MDNETSEQIYNETAEEVGYYIEEIIDDETNKLDNPNQEQVDFFVKKMEEKGQDENVVLLYKKQKLQDLKIEYTAKRRRSKRIQKMREHC